MSAMPKLSTHIPMMLPNLVNGSPSLDEPPQLPPPGLWERLRTDAIDEIERLAHEVAKRFPRAVFFAGKLVFRQERFLDKALHNQAAFTLQRRLQFAGLPMVVLPVRAA